MSGESWLWNGGFEAFGRQVGPGMAVLEALGRQVGPGTTVVGSLGRQVGSGLAGAAGFGGFSVSGALRSNLSGPFV